MIDLFESCSASAGLFCMGMGIGHDYHFVSPGIVLSARIVKFVVESVVTGSAIGQSLLGSGKGVGQSGHFTVGNRPCDGCSGDWRMLC